MDIHVKTDAELAAAADRCIRDFVRIDRLSPDYYRDGRAPEDIERRHYIPTRDEIDALSVRLDAADERCMDGDDAEWIDLDAGGRVRIRVGPSESQITAIRIADADTSDADAEGLTRGYAAALEEIHQLPPGAADILCAAVITTHARTCDGSYARTAIVEPSQSQVIAALGSRRLRGEWIRIAYGAWLRVTHGGHVDAARAVTCGQYEQINRLEAASALWTLRRDGIARPKADVELACERIRDVIYWCASDDGETAFVVFDGIALAD